LPKVRFKYKELLAQQAAAQGARTVLPPVLRKIGEYKCLRILKKDNPANLTG
jgi:hypothetical protein